MYIAAVLIYTCGHYDVDGLINKLKSDGFVVEKLVASDLPSDLNSCIAKVDSGLNEGAILIDCSCPSDHSNLYKAVKSFTRLPLDSPESKKWKIIQLVHSNEEIQSPSWSKIHQVDRMFYSNLNDDVMSAVTRRVNEYISTSCRTSSINSASIQPNSIMDKLEILEQGQQQLKQQINEQSQQSGEQIGAIGMLVQIIIYSFTLCVLC